ncbi:adenine deaminase [Methylobacterium sp. NEAU 140]|uniref:adenine deaminase n=1 Tax=Methylobacterium sp. NEAU 140 TaxID=3064945 RepID=UPI002734E7F6|nr:adenine deaminase [Methylobacterium sp. NEAU 140]MDP4024790.1 adenine deaminase [Methylobacterium sp. NEAU 140]
MTGADGLRRRIDQGTGRAAADLVLKGGRFLDLVTGDLVASDVAVCGDRIVGTHGTYRGAREIDVSGRVIVPGFIDTHFHVESSLMPPLEFERCVLPRGVTTGVCDPHEMANVLGTAAFDWFLDAAGAMAMDLRVQLSACVPAAPGLETSGARIEAADLLRFAGHPRVLGLAEVMNFPGVLAGDPDLLAKLAAFQGRPIDGHAPLLRGLPLNGYVAAGIRTEHEATTAEEALEKLSKGMTVLIREGSVSKDLHALASILTERTAPFLAFCTDDRNPLDIAEEGHLDHAVRTAIRLGCPPLAVYRAASWSAARAFGLHDRGLVAPGQRADLVVLDDVLGCAVSRVICAGRPVDEALFADRAPVAPIGRGSVRVRRVTEADFAAPGSGPSTPVIGVVPGKIITRRLDLALPYRDGERRIDLDQDAVKVAVVERHGRTPPGLRGIGVAFVNGFGLRRGAIASSVGHDCHNITVVGADEADMAVAVNRLAEIEGGFVVAAGGRVLAEIALPLAGLMSLLPFEAIGRELGALRAAARGLGCTLPEPFLQVAFLPLPVIPHLKITDRGLVDVDRFALIEA